MGEDPGEVTGSLERPECPEGLTAGRKGGERGAGHGPGAPAWALVTECFPKGFKEEIPLLPPPSPLHCPQSSPPFITCELFTFQIHLSHFLPLTRPYCQHYPATCVSHLCHVLRHLYLSKARTANVYDGGAANRLHLHRQRSGETRPGACGLEYYTAGKKNAGCFKKFPRRWQLRSQEEPKTRESRGPHETLYVNVHSRRFSGAEGGHVPGIPAQTDGRISGMGLALSLDLFSHNKE